MPIHITVKLSDEASRKMENLSIYDHVGGNRRLYPDEERDELAPSKKPDELKPCEERDEPNLPKERDDFGPFRVATTGSSPRMGRLLFRYCYKEKLTEQIFDVKEGSNLIPEYDNFDAFAKFVRDRGAVPKE